VVDGAAFDQLRVDLRGAGFDRVNNSAGVWEGPVFECFKQLKPDAERMRIEIRDGFPFSLPKVYVKGIPGHHIAANGDVCLWAGTDQSYSWRRLNEIESRAEEWCRRQSEDGFGPEDAALDANLYFAAAASGIALINLSGLDDAPNNDTDQLKGVWDEDRRVLKVERGQGGQVEGRSYFRRRPPSESPRTLEAFKEALTEGQKKNFERRLKAARRGKEIFAVLFWDTDSGRNALALLVQDRDGELDARSIEVAPTDQRYKLLRAGPDSPVLMAKKAVIFGVGAIGSHVALTLGACGFGSLTLVDHGHLRPADSVRHSAGGVAVGEPKTSAMQALLAFKASWATVKVVNEAPWDPERISELVDGTDVVVEATGYGRFADLLSIICTELHTPMVSGALYRAGAIARIKGQIPGQTPLAERIDEKLYPVIPPGPEVAPAWEPGCSEPVNNASPARVTRAAGHLADTVIDVIAGREIPEDAVEVYEPINIAPFDHRGRLEFPQ